MKIHYAIPILLVACSGSSASVEGSSSDAGTDSEIVDGATGDASPPSDASPSSDASTQDAARDAGHDDRIDPIDVGRSWTYHVQIFGTSPCQSGTQTGTALSKSVVAGKDGYKVQSFCAAYG